MYDPPINKTNIIDVIKASTILITYTYSKVSFSGDSEFKVEETHNILLWIILSDPIHEFLNVPLLNVYI